MKGQESTATEDHHITKPTPPPLTFDIRQLDYHQLLPRPNPPVIQPKRHSPHPPPALQFTSPFAHQAQKHYENWTPQQQSSKHDIKDKPKASVRHSSSIKEASGRNEKKGGIISDEQRQIYEHLGIQLYTNRGQSSPQNVIRPHHIQQSTREPRSHKNNTEVISPGQTQQRFFKKDSTKQSPRNTPIIIDDLASPDEDTIANLYSMKKFYTNRRFDFIKFFERQCGESGSMALTGQRIFNPTPTPPPLTSNQTFRPKLNIDELVDSAQSKKKKLSGMVITNFITDEILPTQGGQGVQRNLTEQISKTEGELISKVKENEILIESKQLTTQRKLSQKRGEKLRELRETAKFFIDRIIPHDEKVLSATMPKMSGKNLKMQKAQIENNIVKVQRKMQPQMQKRTDNTYEPMYPSPRKNPNGLDIFSETVRNNYQYSKQQFNDPASLASTRQNSFVKTSTMTKRIKKLDDCFERKIENPPINEDIFPIDQQNTRIKPSPNQISIKPGSSGRPIHLMSLPQTPSMPLNSDHMAAAHIDRKKRFAELMKFSCENDIQILHNRINLLQDPKYQGQQSQTQRGGAALKEGQQTNAFSHKFSQSKKAVSFCLPPVTPTPTNQIAPESQAVSFQQAAISE
ncbi:hypothetical protein FGO68_gene6445 [Halteria grandinella]|uniref:Uncharacterized protein n=1 Tax=Halteria grandinella TaxID=5974 RepID=A0A8J8P5E1_HALGN|nr:hypothetical protein FGO68_gene6445 [Halteria grandinella]